MRKLFLMLILLVSISSCKIYTYPPQPEIKSILAVTSQGDTIQVSTDYLQREFETNPGKYSNWRFNWNYNWYYGYGWYNYYDPYWMYRIPYQNRITIQPRPRVSTPRYIPRHFDNRPETPLRTPQTQPNRGRSNNDVRVQPRTRTTPNVVPNRPNINRGNSSNIRKDNNN